MAAIDTLRDHCAELLIRATQGICDGSRLNAEAGHADARARLDDWDSVRDLYRSAEAPVRATA
ncbi:hypothetical protein HPO96_03885 [Kribbella sandramycini]|uniref:Uncharacterized protein n=1 Tax=Kribbella sandramycini TaxID=60450 RepID=A0A7Y4NYQ0_9ACTN|nr:hypothetical protein [Kribbella sandramycini]MBB6568026.1 hypothetical protein [Kribbella sandramycini]NOL39380.1 hypothetical protein [Kribbella sandramycini]